MISPSQFRAETRRYLTKQLNSKLEEPFNSNQLILEKLSQRYFNCIELEETPSRDFLSEYLFSNNASMAAISCEFYGGFQYEYIESRKHMKNLRDFEFGLETAYYLLFKDEHPLNGIDSQAKEILSSFRKTTHHIKSQGDKIIAFYN